MLPAVTRWLKGRTRKQPIRSHQRSPMQILRLEDRVTPAIAAAIATGPGVISRVDVLDETGAVLTSFQPYGNTFLGGVNVAVGDFTGDGVLDIVTGAGFSPFFPQYQGGPHVEIFDGAGLLGGNDRPLHSFFPYAANFTGGVFVAAGDLTGDHIADLVTSPGAGGGPHVQAWSFENATMEPVQRLLSFNAYTNPDGSLFTGGVRVAVGDLGGDNGGVAGSRTLGDAEIITVPGPGGGPLVRLWDYDNQEFDPDNFGNFVAAFGDEAVEPYRGGLFAASGWFTANRDEDNYIYADIVLSAGGGSPSNPVVLGGSPHVLTYRLAGFYSPDRREGAEYILANAEPGLNEDTGLPEIVTPNAFAASFFADDVNFHGGVTVGVITVPASNDSNATDNIITGLGPDVYPPPVGVNRPPIVKIYEGFTGAILNEFTAFGDPNFTGGVNVG